MNRPKSYQKPGNLLRIGNMLYIKERFGGSFGKGWRSACCGAPTKDPRGHARTHPPVCKKVR